MRRIFPVVLVAVATCAASTAIAHQGNPNMQSVVRSVTPGTSGVSIEVINRDDRFELTNRSKEAVVIYGYDEEQYARVLPDGSVQVNKRSPAYYLNDDRYANVVVPASADPNAAPQWSTIGKTARFQWHDHRMHYMATGVPSSVKDQSKRQRIFDYEIPVRIGGKPGAIDGTLFWTPQPDRGPPLTAVAALVVIALGGLVAIIAVRARRGTREGKEAW